MERKPTEHKDSLRHQQSIGPVRAVSTSALEANQTSGKHGQATYTSKYLLQETGGWAHFIIRPHTHNRQSTSFSNATALWRPHRVSRYYGNFTESWGLLQPLVTPNPKEFSRKGW